MAAFQVHLYHYFMVGLVLSAIYFIVPGIITKVLPILGLCFLCFLQGNKGSGNKYCKYIATGLLLSACGDASLELHYDVANFFLIGLSFFLAAHLCYIKAFYDCGITFSNDVVITCSIIVLVYYVVIMYFLLTSVSVIMIAPVAIYGAVISSMCFLAVNRYNTSYMQQKQKSARISTAPEDLDLNNTISINSGIYALIGALFFVTSDSILSINTFYISIGYSSELIMSTYYAAQLFIAVSCFECTDIDTNPLLYMPYEKIYEEFQ